LYVTFEPGSMTNPARGATNVNRVFGVKSPRNWWNTNTRPMMTITVSASPANLYGGVRGEFNGAVIALHGRGRPGEFVAASRND
jgi:hypothetical protein